jgi:hypothetical protein
MRPNKRHIIEHSGISDCAYTDRSSYSKFLLLHLHLGCTTNKREIPFGYLLHLLVFRSSRSSSVFSVVFIAEDVDGVGDKGSGDTTVVNVETLLDAFLNMSLRSACFIDEAFLW